MTRSYACIMLVGLGCLAAATASRHAVVVTVSGEKVCVLDDAGNTRCREQAMDFMDTNITVTHVPMANSTLVLRGAAQIALTSNLGCAVLNGSLRGPWCWTTGHHEQDMHHTFELRPPPPLLLASDRRPLRSRLVQRVAVFGQEICTLLPGSPPCLDCPVM